MTVQVTNNGNGTSTITLSVTTATAKIVDTLDLMGKDLWCRGLGPSEGEGEENELIPWEDLSNGQKLDMIRAYLIRVIRDLAEHRKRENLAQAAKAAAEIELVEILI